MLTEDHQSLTALAALLMWPIVCLCIFASSRNFSRALIWSVLGAQLLLPVAASIKFQMVPQIDKASVANFSALLGCIIFARGKSVGSFSRFGLVEVLLLLNVVTPIITSQLNPDNIIIGGRFLPGVGLYDAISAAEAAMIALIPFLLGRRFLRTADDCRNILVILTIAGLFYSIPLLFEIRFSPQLHNWVYGYYPTEFAQAIREGGFRPMVFMGHGLLAAFFLMTSFLAAATLWRAGVILGAFRSSIAAPYLGIVLLLCKSLGALIYGVVGGMLVLFTKPKTQIQSGYALGNDLFGLSSATLIRSGANQADRRSGRVDRRRARRIPKLSNSRMKTFCSVELSTGRCSGGAATVAAGSTIRSGKDISVTDGRWVIAIGQFGLIGFLAEFGLLSICIYRAASAFRLVRSAREQLPFAALALIVSINIFDLLPNSGLLPGRGLQQAHCSDRQKHWCSPEELRGPGGQRGSSHLHSPVQLKKT